MITVYHNPRCSKSRAAVQLLTERDEDFTIHLYLENPMPENVLLKALEVLGEDVMLRKNEADYKTHIAGKGLQGQQLAKAMLAYPKTIERPLVVHGAQMAMGRPLDNILNII